MEKASLSAVICTCDRYDFLPEAIESVLAQSIPVDCIVVDNSARRADAEAFGARYRHRPLRYIYEPVQGLSNARNKGTALARGDIVAFLDDDAVAAPDWAENLCKAFAAFPAAGCVGGRIVGDWLAPRPDWLGDDLLGWLSIIDWGGTPHELTPAEWAAGCNIAYDREALLATGGFPTSLGRKGAGTGLLSNEEIAVNDKLKAAGKAVVYTPHAAVRHKIPADRLTRRWFLRRAAWQGVSDFIAYARKPDKKAAWRYKIRMRLLPFWPSNAGMPLQLADIHALVLERLHAAPRLIDNLDAEGHRFLSASLKINL